MSLHQFTLPDSPPRDLDDLGRRALRLAGRTLGELAALAGQEIPDELRRSKGFAGQLLERWLGARAGNRPAPDFASLGVELKSLPVDDQGRPLQSTYVSAVPLRDLDRCRWLGSPVRAKLRHVLWVPVQAARVLPLAQRRVGQAFFWRACPEEEALLRADWEFHLARIRAGHVEAIRGRDGAVLQIRPKGRDSSIATWADLPNQGAVVTGPRGFYLRPAFTRYLIQRYFFGRRCRL